MASSRNRMHVFVSNIIITEPFRFYKLMILIYS